MYFALIAVSHISCHNTFNLTRDASSFGSVEYLAFEALLARSQVASAIFAAVHLTCLAITINECEAISAQQALGSREILLLFATEANILIFIHVAVIAEAILLFHEHTSDTLLTEF